MLKKEKLSFQIVKITFDRSFRHGQLISWVILSGGLSGAVNGFWEVSDADQGKGVVDFEKKGELWKKRRALSKNFWAE